MSRPRLPPGTKVREKRWIADLTLIWLVAAATLVGPTTAADPIYPGANECNGTSELTCHLQSGKEYEVIDLPWPKVKKVMIYGNGSSLSLKHRRSEACAGGQQRELHIYDASRVITTDLENDCAMQLILYNCRGVTIQGGVDLVRMNSSHADKVILPTVTQFDLDNSTIGEVSLTVNRKMSTLQDSRIELVKKLEIEGSFAFKMIDCTLGRVNNFILNNTHSQAPQVQRVTMGQVSPHGIQVIVGKLDFHAIISVVETAGIQVFSGASLLFNSGEIGSFSDDSIVVEPRSKIVFQNVRLGENPSVFFTFEKASFLAHPLVFLKRPWVAPMGWIAIGVTFGLLVGFVATVALMRFVKNGSFPVSSMDTSKLLSQEQPPPQAEKGDTDPLFKKNDVPKSIPAPPNRPLPNVPNRMSQNEYYVDVLSTASPPPMEMTPPPGIAQRPPYGLPKEPQQTKSPLSLSIRDRFRGKSNFLPPVMKHSKQDPRDALPPPPPPDEDMYDDPGDMTLQFPPHPLPPNRQPPEPPQMGKPFPPPADCNELYDDVQDMSQRPPAPPPSANKPVLGKGKPKPPPPSRKPNRY